MSNLDCNRPLEALHISQYPIDSLESLPDYFLTERDIVDEATGNRRYALTRTPAMKLFPQGNMDNVTALEPNNSAITIPENQVRAGYIRNEGNMVSMQYATSARAAQFLMIGTLSDMVLIQNTGFVNIPEGHEYIVGAQYYNDGNGVPTTDDSLTGQKLFVPLSSTKLAINL